jgi:hypothetical protein
MQNSLFSDLIEILPHLAMLDRKIANLRWIAKQIEGCKVETFITLPDKTVIPIDQHVVPFKLDMELKTLIEDSIDEYQRQHDHLKRLFDETNS